MGTARQEILDKLQNAVHKEQEKPNYDAPVYHSITKPLDESFKENLEMVNGNVYLCATKQDLYSQLNVFLAEYNPATIFCNEMHLQKFLAEGNLEYTEYHSLPEHIEVGITSCEFLIAHTGSAMVSSAQKGGRQLFVYPPIHVILATKNQLVDYLETAYSEIQKKYEAKLPSQITIITGPSRTADIEKTLVMGAHGPRELHVFIY